MELSSLIKGLGYIILGIGFILSFSKNESNKIPPAGTGGIFSSLMKLSSLINFYMSIIP